MIPNPYQELFEIPIAIGRLSRGDFFRFIYKHNVCACVFRVEFPVASHKSSSRLDVYVRMHRHDRRCVWHSSGINEDGYVEHDEQVHQVYPYKRE